MTPDKDTHYSLLCETSYSEYKPVNKDTIVEDTIQGLINAGMLKDEDRKDIVSTWTYHADYSYPTPSVERDGILAQVIPFLERHDVYSRGRFGMWKYEVSNTDHTLMQGVEVVNRLLLGEPESTIGIKYESTLDGRNAASHERPQVAGSGDPKKKAEAAAAGTGSVTVMAKDNPDAVQSAHPGKADASSAAAATASAAAVKPSVRSAAPAAATGHKDVGDKREVHTSEEELGVTTPDGGNDD